MNFLDQYLDKAHILLIFGGSFALMVIGVELGFRFGSHWLGQQSKAQPSQVRALMGAALGLLGFMLAFSFSIAQSHFELRAQAYLEEVRAITSSYLSASFLDAGSSQEARALLTEFVDSRVAIIELARDSAGDQPMEKALHLINRGEQIHHELWQLGQGQESAGQNPSSRVFSESVIRLMEANEQRKQASIYNRISPVIWVTLILMSVLAMLVTGYQAGLAGSHSRLAIWSLAIIFAAVMALVIDLDRPRMSLFQMNQQQMFELQQQMHADRPQPVSGTR
jgi:hypothetical protein